jgi:ketosteroid isomerase-like protein
LAGEIALLVLDFSLSAFRISVMKPSILFLSILTLLPLSLAQGADPEEAAVLQTERDLALAYQKSDPAGITRGVMEDYTLTNSSGQVTTRANDLEEAKKVDPKYEIFENHDMKVRVHDDTAVVLGITRAKGLSGGKPFDAQFQFTDTFVKDAGRWRLYAGHVTKIIAPASKPAASSITPDELIRRTQELYDSIVPGNQEPWKKYYADDCIFADEKGRIMDKAKLVADVTPMPAGYSGSIKIENAQSRIMNDIAVLSYDANETETIFGQHLAARYHTTDTWLRRDGDWQIIASQAHRYYEDPAIGEADPKKFADFIGAYELAPGQSRTVSVENNQLFIERKGKKEQLNKKEPLFPETPDIFFRKSVEGRILFRRKVDGQIDALIDRRNNEDVIWRKVKNVGGT